MAKEEGTVTAVELVLDALFEQGHATSIDIAGATELPISQVSSALSRIYKRLPQVIARDEGKRPYRWRVLMETTPEEAYKMYMAPMEAEPSEVCPTMPVGSSIPDPGPPLPGVVGPTVGGPSEVQVTISGRIEIAVGWVGRL